MRFGLAAIWIALAVAGCQSTAGDPVVTAEPPSVETALSASNDPGRLGRAHLASGNYAMAERQFRDAVEKNREDAPSWIGLAAAYDNLGRFDLADRAYQQAIRIGGETLELINNRGYSFLLRGDGPSARAQFERALTLDPDNVVITNNIRLLQLGQRNVRGTPL